MKDVWQREGGALDPSDIQHHRHVEPSHRTDGSQVHIPTLRSGWPRQPLPENSADRCPATRPRRPPCLRRLKKDAGMARIRPQLLQYSPPSLRVGKGAERHAGSRFSENFGQSRRRKSLLHSCHRIVEPAMKRAEVYAVCCQAQRACTDPLDRFHSVDDLQNREHFRRLHERHSAPEPSMRLNDPAPGEALEHFGKISSRNSRRLRDLIGCPSDRRLAGQMDDRSEGILHSLRKHKKSSSRH